MKDSAESVVEMFKRATSNEVAENNAVFDRAANSLSVLEMRGASGDSEAARLYRQLVEVAVHHWAFGLPTGEEPKDDLSPLLKGHAPESRDEMALRWAFGVARLFPNGQARLIESAGHQQFQRQADKWIKAFWGWVDKHVPPGLRARLMDKSQELGATSPEFYADKYLLRRAVFFSVTREEQRYFNAKHIRNHVPLFVLAEIVDDKAVVDELDRQRRITPEHLRHACKDTTRPQHRLPGGGDAEYALILCWLAGVLWQVPVKDRADELTRLMGMIIDAGPKPRFMPGQVHTARRKLQLEAEPRGRRKEPIT